MSEKLERTILNNYAIERLIRDHTKLTWPQKSLAWLILSYRLPWSVYAERKHKDLCRVTGCNRDQLSRRLAALKKHRILIPVPSQTPPDSRGKKRYPHSHFYFIPDLPEAEKIVSEIWKDGPEKQAVLNDFLCAHIKIKSLDEGEITAHRRRTSKALPMAASRSPKD